MEKGKGRENNIKIKIIEREKEIEIKEGKGIMNISPTYLCYTDGRKGMDGLH